MRPVGALGGAGEGGGEGGGGEGGGGEGEGGGGGGGGGEGGEGGGGVAAAAAGGVFPGAAVAGLGGCGPGHPVIDFNRWFDDDRVNTTHGAYPLEFTKRERGAGGDGDGYPEGFEPFVLQRADEAVPFDETAPADGVDGIGGSGGGGGVCSSRGVGGGGGRGKGGREHGRDLAAAGFTFWVSESSYLLRTNVDGDGDRDGDGDGVVAAPGGAGPLGTARRRDDGDGTSASGGLGLSVMMGDVAETTTTSTDLGILSVYALASSEQISKLRGASWRTFGVKQLSHCADDDATPSSAAATSHGAVTKSKSASVSASTESAAAGESRGGEHGGEHGEKGEKRLDKKPSVMMYSIMTANRKDCLASFDNHAHYAAKHGYGLIKFLLNEDAFPVKWNGFPMKTPKSLKFVLALEMMRFNLADTYIWIDCDMVFTNQERRWEDVLRMAEGASLILPRDMSYLESDPARRELVNTGVVIMRPGVSGVGRNRRGDKAAAAEAAKSKAKAKAGAESSLGDAQLASSSTTTSRLGSNARDYLERVLAEVALCDPLHIDPVGCKYNSCQLVDGPCMTDVLVSLGELNRTVLGVGGGGGTRSAEASGKSSSSSSLLGGVKTRMEQWASRRRGQPTGGGGVRASSSAAFERHHLTAVLPVRVFDSVKALPEAEETGNGISEDALTRETSWRPGDFLAHYMRGNGSPEQLLSILRDSARSEITRWLGSGDDEGGAGGGDGSVGGGALKEGTGGKSRGARQGGGGGGGGGGGRGKDMPTAAGLGTAWGGGDGLSSNGGGARSFNSGGAVRFMSCDRRDLLPSGDQMRDIIHKLKVDLNKVTAAADSKSKSSSSSSSDDDDDADADADDEKADE